MYLPGVSSIGVAAVRGDRIEMRPAVHLRQERDASARGVVEIRAAVRSGNDPRSVSGLFHTCRAVTGARVGDPDASTDAGVRRARSRARHRRRVVARTRCAIHPATSVAIDRSTSTARSISSGVALSVRCRSSSDRRVASTNASLLPSGDHCGSPDAPFAANSRFAAAIHRSASSRSRDRGRRPRRRSSARSPVRRRRRFASACRRRTAQTRCRTCGADEAIDADSAAVPPSCHCALRRARRRRTSRRR